MIKFKDAQEKYDTLYGLHSRIPVCCIRFFIDEWAHMYKGRDRTAYGKALDASHAGYVQCPACLGSGHKVKIRICINECGRECREDFISAA